MLNRVVLVGRMVQDAELKYTPSGVAVSNFRLAVNRPFKNKETGENEADFINIVVWRRPAENTAQYTKKGSLVGIDGRLQSRTYEGNDGKTVFVTEVVADSVQFLDSKGSSSKASSQQEKVEAYNNELEKHNEIDISDSDLPF